MFNVVDAPPSNKIGPIEKTYKEFGLLDGTTKLIQLAIDKGEIPHDKASLLSLFSYSVLMGVAYLDMNRARRYGNAPSPVWETVQLSKLDVSSESFKKYTLRVLENILYENSNNDIF
ncbi:unnamed protein product [marine sediment metagenome]|uniref:Uncharacterized protein n=1 Tax=marine sediment metagenome TaxID=412755 RepID=X1CYE0_9ZZZZ